jgi:hypothetical protein
VFEGYLGYVSSILYLQLITRSMFYTCSGEVAFIRPLRSPSEQRSCEDLDGIATVLLSHVVDSIDDHDSHSLEDTNVERRSSNEHVSDKIITDDDDVSMNYIDKSIDEISSTVSINVPFEAHVLPGRGRRFCSVLPLLCVADEDNICCLLSSVLYQRYVWGIDEPVVGISFSKTGTIGRVMFGWLDERSSESDDLVRDLSCSIKNVHT